MTISQLLTLGLGSNVGDRLAFLRDAVYYLNRTLFIDGSRLSAIYETPALLKPGAPADWDTPYLNMALCGFTKRLPHDILSCTQAAERELGRRYRGIWAPREIDIDILTVGSHVITSSDLTLPHPHIYKRPFVLAPLSDLFPDSDYAEAFFQLNKKDRPGRASSAFSTEKIAPDNNFC